MEKRFKLTKDGYVVLGILAAVLLLLLGSRGLKKITSPEKNTEPLVFYTTEPLPQEEPQPTVTEPVQTVPPTTAPMETTVETTAPVETTVPPTAPPETKPPEVSIDEIPLYLQTDYPDVRYGDGLLADSGSGITCVAMVATYLTDHVYQPDALAHAFGGTAYNNIDRVNNALEQMQLPYQTDLNIHETLRELKAGKVAIVLLNKKSVFKESQHFLVLSRINDAGTIMVLDPYGPNYEDPFLKTGFAEGFQQGNFSGAFGKSWVFDKADMPEEPFLYEEDVYQGEKRYDFDLTEEETELLAKLLWMEVRSEPAEGQQAAAEVVLNRLAAENFPDTLEWVIKAEGQFLSANQLYEAKPTQTQYDAIERALNGPYILPEDVVFYSTGPVNENVWGKIGAHVFCYQW